MTALLSDFPAQSSDLIPSLFCIVTPFSPSIGHTIDLASVTPFYLLPCPGPIYLLPVVPGPIYLLPVVATWIRETPLWERSELRRIYSLARSHSLLLEYTHRIGAPPNIL